MTGRANADAIARGRRVGLALPTILASLLCGGSVLALSLSGAAELGGARGETGGEPGSGGLLGSGILGELLGRSQGSVEGNGRVVGLAALAPPSAVSAPPRRTPTDGSIPTSSDPAASAGRGGPSHDATGDGATGDPAPARTAPPAVQILFTRGPISGRYTPPPVKHPHRPPVAPVPAPSPTGPGSAPAPAPAPAPASDPGPVAEQPPPDQAPDLGPLDADGDHDGSVVVAGDHARPVCPDRSPDADSGHDAEAATQSCDD